MIAFQKRSTRTLLTIEELRKLLKETRNTDIELPMLLMVSNGLRIGKVIGLRWRNVDLENKVLHIKDGLSPSIESGTRILEEKDFKYIKIVRDEKLCPNIIPYLENQRYDQNKAKKSGKYYDNDLVMSKEDGSPILYNQFATKCRWLIQRTLTAQSNPLTELDIRYSVLKHVNELGGYEKYWTQLFAEEK